MQKGRRPLLPSAPNDSPFIFDDEIFQTETQSLEKFKIISVQSSQNKKFKSFMNEFKVKSLKDLMTLKKYIAYFKN